MISSFASIFAYTHTSIYSQRREILFMAMKRRRNKCKKETKTAMQKYASVQCVLSREYKRLPIFLVVVFIRTRTISFKKKLFAVIFTLKKTKMLSLNAKSKINTHLDEIVVCK